MGRFLILVAFLGALAQTSTAADIQPETCEQIRAQIGVLPLADPELLRKLAARKDCRFSAAEVYKAAYGDRPPARETRQYRRTDDDDDD